MARKSRKPSVNPAPVMENNRVLLYRAGIYVRLSVEDNGGDTKDSIQNQTEYLKEYIDREHKDLQLVRIYTDNGTSGTNFDRDGWKHLMEDLKSGEIQCIVVKDFSRIGRNYIEVGNYMEKIFPFLGIRVISVNDSFDSQKKSFHENMLMNSLVNIVNDYYAKDISRKVVQARKIMQKNGEYTGGACPYGYRKSEADKRKLSVDPEAADVVKKIYEWRTQGKSNGWIANALNELAVPSPGLYQFLHGNQAYRRSSLAKWNTAHISGILKNLVYLGHLAQGKSKRSYFRENGTKKRICREDWIISENTHEPLVTQKQFDIVTAMAEESLKRYRRQQDANETVPHMENPLRRKVFCGQCGLRMSRRSKVRNGKRNYCYFCDSKRTRIDLECTQTTIQEEKLMGAIRGVAERQLQIAGIILERGRLSVQGESSGGSQRKPFTGKETDKYSRSNLSPGDKENAASSGNETKVRQAEAYEKELADELLLMREKRQQLYEDWKEGMLTSADYEYRKEQLAEKQLQYEKEQAEQRKRIEQNKAEQEKMAALENCYEKAMKTGESEIPFTVLDALIEKIVVLSAKRIDIKFAFSDFIAKRCADAQITPMRMKAGGSSE
ncbi:MAG: recombinase family protein [Lachnospiraceae bacterium]|nr:recombinase family protein [uncultured Acetatifactor sp.]MCI8286477.1 recombinase family protein [Lachnospiraceae bacterium]